MIYKKGTELRVVDGEKEVEHVVVVNHQESLIEARRIGGVPADFLFLREGGVWKLGLKKAGGKPYTIPKMPSFQLQVAG